MLSCALCAVRYQPKEPVVSKELCTGSERSPDPDLTAIKDTESGIIANTEQLRKKRQ
jgi:hypothetical protein